MRLLNFLPGRPPAADPGDGDGPDQPFDTNDRVTRALRELYSAPSDSYWDSLEARVVAAVRAGRESTTAVVEWWHTLAAWARPGLAAAAVVLVVVAATALQSRAARVAADVARAESRLEPLEPELARAFDLVDPDAEARARETEARDIANLLIDGVYRRPRLTPPHDARPAPRPTAESDEQAVLRARREATFRYVMP